MSRNNYSLKQENIILVMLVIFVVIVFASISSFILLDIYKQKKVKTYIQEGKTLQYNISELFDDVDKYMKFVGQE